MTTVSGTFSAKGVSATGTPAGIGEVVVTISNTFVADVYVERSGPSQMSWERVTGKLLSGAVATVSAFLNDRFRVRAATYTSGTVTYSMALPVAFGVSVNAGSVVVEGAGDVTVGDDVSVGGNLRRSYEFGIDATGADATDAYQLTADFSVVSTAAASTGVLLPALEAGLSPVVFNEAGNNIIVYSADTTIDGEAGEDGVPLSTGSRAIFFAVGTVWVSAQLGVGAS